MIFDKISPSADFFSKIQLQLDIVNKNVLYITHECDKILKLVKRLETSQNLQKQVDEFFDETSPQTDQENT